MDTYSNPLEYILPTILDKDINSNSSCIYIELVVLISFIALFLYGLVLKRRLKNRRERKISSILITNIKGIVDIGQIIKLSETWEDVFIKNLPGMMLIVGLLGTFWGLGFGIKEMAKVLVDKNMPQEQIYKSLNDSLLILGVKFKSSLWGIIFCLLSRYKFKNVYFEHKSVAIEEVKKKLAEQQKIEDRQRINDLRFKEELLNEIKVINTVIKNTINDQIQAIIRQNDQITNAIFGMERSNSEASNSLQSAVNIFKGTTLNLQTTVSNFSSEVQNTIESTKTVVTSVRDFIEESKGAIQNSVAALKSGISESFDSFSSNVTDTLNKISVELKRTTNGINQSIIESTETTNKSSANSSQLISDATDNLSTQIGGMSEKIQSNIKDIEGIMKQTKNEISVLNDIMAKLNAIFNNLDKTNSNQQLICKEMNTTSKDLGKILGKSILSKYNDKQNLIPQLQALSDVIGEIRNILANNITKTHLTSYK